MQEQIFSPGLPLSEPAPWWREWECAALVGLVLLTYFTRLTAMPVCGEESRWANGACEMIASGDWIVPRQQGTIFPERPPLNSWLMGLAGLVLGDVDLMAVRLPSALATLALTLLIYAYAQQGMSPLASFARRPSMPRLDRCSRWAGSASPRPSSLCWWRARCWSGIGVTCADGCQQRHGRRATRWPRWAHWPKGRRRPCTSVWPREHTCSCGGIGAGCWHADTSWGWLVLPCWSDCGWFRLRVESGGGRRYLDRARAGAILLGRAGRPRGRLSVRNAGVLAPLVAAADCVRQAQHAALVDRQSTASGVSDDCRGGYVPQRMAGGGRPRSILHAHVSVPGDLGGAGRRRCTAAGAELADRLIWRRYLRNRGGNSGRRCVLAVLNVVGLPRFAELEQPTLFLVVWLAMAALTSGLLFWASLGETSARPQLAVAALAGFLGLSYCGVIVNVRVNSGNDLSPAIADIKQALAPGCAAREFQPGLPSICLLLWRADRADRLAGYRHRRAQRRRVFLLRPIAVFLRSAG